MIPLHKQITTPNDCVLGVAIPTTRDALWQQYRSGRSKKDFVFHLLEIYQADNPDQIWARGYGKFIEKFHTLLSVLSDAGVTVIQQIELQHIQNLGPHKVLTLFAHWSLSHSGVELTDGIYSPETFSAMIPKTYEGIFDLSVCYSVYLQEAIKREHPDCHVIAHKKPVALEFYLIIYKYILRLLLASPKNYLDAFSTTLLTLANKTDL